MQLEKKSIDPRHHRFPALEYPLYFRQLYRQYGWRAFVKQFRFQYRRVFSRRLLKKYAPVGFGIELGVGAFTLAPVTRTVLTDGFHSHASTRTIATCFCDANRIPAADSTFDFILSEHVLEHLCNPIRAIKEWARILKPGGRVFVFLPHKERTFDRNRPRTRLSHLLDDFRSDLADPDSTHLREWEEQVIQAGLAPHYAEIAGERHVHDGIIHHHVWITEDIVELFTALGFRVLFSQDECPDRRDSFVVIAEKTEQLWKDPA